MSMSPNQIDFSSRLAQIGIISSLTFHDFGMIYNFIVYYIILNLNPFRRFVIGSHRGDASLTDHAL
jgi:hypothetical protein